MVDQRTNRRSRAIINTTDYQQKYINSGINPSVTWYPREAKFYSNIAEHSTNKKQQKARPILGTVLTPYLFPMLTTETSTTKTKQTTYLAFI